MLAAILASVAIMMLAEALYRWSWFWSNVVDQIGADGCVRLESLQQQQNK